MAAFPREWTNANAIECSGFLDRGCHRIRARLLRLPQQWVELDGDVSPGYVYRSMLYQSRILVIGGFVLSAWGLGSFINALLAGRRNDQLPPSA